VSDDQKGGERGRTTMGRSRAGLSNGWHEAALLSEADVPQRALQGASGCPGELLRHVGG